MVAIVDPQHEVDLDALAKGLDENLPAFARPLFLRILSEITLTGMVSHIANKKLTNVPRPTHQIIFSLGTYKIVKTDLKKESFNVNVVNDELYYKDPSKGFIRMTPQLYDDIINGVVKV